MFHFQTFRVLAVHSEARLAFASLTEEAADVRLMAANLQLKRTDYAAATAGGMNA